MNFIPLSRPDINSDDVKVVADVLLSGMLVQGVKVVELEKDIASYLEIENVIAVSNGTASLHLALIALGVGVGDEVIVPAFSFIATANVVELVGAKPVFVDIDLDTFNIDVKNIEAAITSQTRAIIPVHEFGLACDIESIMFIARKHNLFVIEDAACALGSKQNGKYVGTFGTFGSFSLHPRKTISSGEGGLLTTSDPMLAEIIKIKRNHGVKMIDGKMAFVDVGFNYRLTDFQAALVDNQLKRLEEILIHKQTLASIYFKKIKNKKIKTPCVPNDRNHTWQTFHVLLDRSIERDKTIELLKAKNIGTNYGAQCIPAQIYFQEKYKLDCNLLFPNSMLVYKQGLAIPIYGKLTEEDISYIAGQLNKL